MSKIKINRLTNANIYMDGNNLLQVYGLTYDGSSKNEGIKLYNSDTRIDVSNEFTAGYVAMENSNSSIGSFVSDASGVKTQVGSHKCYVIALIKEELSPEQIKGLSQLLLGYANSL